MAPASEEATAPAEETPTAAPAEETPTKKAKVLDDEKKEDDAPLEQAPDDQWPKPGT